MSKRQQITSAVSTNNSSANNIRAWMLGSILSGGGSVPSPNSPTGWADLVDGFEYRALATRLQIPLIYGLDTVHGNNNMIGVTVFPHNIGMGATRDPALSELEGEVTAQETRSAGPQWGFAPCICVARVEPKLIELVRGSFLRVKPYISSFGLAELASV